MEKIKNWYKKIFNGNLLIAILLMFIFIISILISMKTGLSKHPDESIHYKAVEYYQTYNLPPKFLDKKIENTYSVHGESRLTRLRYILFFGGKV